MRAREIFLALSLIALFALEGASFRRWELKRRVRLIPRLASLPIEEAERQGSEYEFDRKFGSFLEKVRRVVPRGASVALSVPGTTRLYLYTAHYALAPSPVVEARPGAQADFQASYDPSDPGRVWVKPSR